MIMLYYGNEDGAIGSHFPFNFDFITDLSAESNARDFVFTILKWLTYMPYGGVPNWVVRTEDIMIKLKSLVFFFYRKWTGIKEEELRVGGC